MSVSLFINKEIPCQNSLSLSLSLNSVKEEGWVLFKIPRGDTDGVVEVK